MRGFRFGGVARAVAAILAAAVATGCTSDDLRNMNSGQLYNASAAADLVAINPVFHPRLRRAAALASRRGQSELTRRALENSGGDVIQVLKVESASRAQPNPEPLTLEERYNLGHECFFSCNYHKDFNDDGRAAFEDFVGVKEKFRADEKVTFASLMVSRQGFDLTLKLFGPTGEVVETRSKKLSCYSEASHWDFQPGRFDPGIYRAAWYIGDCYVGGSEMQIVGAGEKRVGVKEDAKQGK